MSYTGNNKQCWPETQVLMRIENIKVTQEEQNTDDDDSKSKD
jgi:hypothetical protein